ncbi:MAG: hypothetical protein HC830_08160 [Bacteroidetes bacterium]|nr:hypothetical protein [Bacteroidota bacterium]
MGNEILVIGSTNVDFLIKGDKLPMLGETVTDGIFLQNFGGKGANQAVGAARGRGGRLPLLPAWAKTAMPTNWLRTSEMMELIPVLFSEKKGLPPAQR